MDASGNVACPFHEDAVPSCRIYSDHYHCFGCGAHGSRLDWLQEVEGMTRTEAINALQDWNGANGVAQEQPNDNDRLAFAMSIWEAAGPLQGSIGERYLAETRGIDVSKLPAIHDTLHFHPRCPFGAGARHPCVVALMRDPVTDAPVGIHRIGLSETNAKIDKLDRKALGRMGVVKLWPLDGTGQLVIGEGIETVLAAATRMEWHGTPLTPAWSAVAKGGLARPPVLREIKRRIQLVDNDASGAGQKAAERGRQAWGKCAIPLMPKETGLDWNDVILRRKVS